MHISYAFRQRAKVERRREGRGIMLQAAFMAFVCASIQFASIGTQAPDKSAQGNLSLSVTLIAKEAKIETAALRFTLTNKSSHPQWVMDTFSPGRGLHCEFLDENNKPMNMSPFPGILCFHGINRDDFVRIAPAQSITKTFPWKTYFKTSFSARFNLRAFYSIEEFDDTIWSGKIGANVLQMEVKQGKVKMIPAPRLVIATKKRIPQSEDTNSNQEFVLVATVPNSAAKSAFAALDRAGIVFEFDGSRVTGIRVHKQDFDRAKDVLKADAQSHHYKIFF